MDILNINKANSNNNINGINSLNSIEDNFSAADSFMSRDYSTSKTKLNVNNNKRIRRNRNKIVRDTIAAMALCNNVTPIFEEEEENNNNDNKDSNINIY